MNKLNKLGQGSNVNDIDYYKYQAATALAIKNGDIESAAKYLKLANQALDGKLNVYENNDDILAAMIPNHTNGPHAEDGLGNELRPPKPWEKDKIIMEQLKSDLQNATKKYKKLGQDIATVFLNSDSDAVNIVLNNSSNINKAAQALDIDPALIQAVLHQEIRFFNYFDYASDAAVVNTQSYYEQLEIYSNLSSWKKMFIAPPAITTPLKHDSSTGLGQIFAETAIEALNWDCGEIRYDINNIATVFDIWNKLHDDDEYNVYMAGLVLKHAAYMVSTYNSEVRSENDVLGTNNNYDLSSTYINSLSDKEKDANGQTERERYIARVLARCNGTNKQAMEYGIHVYNYYKTFDEYNKKKK